MAHELIVHGRNVGHAFIPDDPLPDAEGSAELIIRPNAAPSTVSIFDLLGKAPHLRSAADIAAQIDEDRKDWGEP